MNSQITEHVQCEQEAKRILRRISRIDDWPKATSQAAAMRLAIIDTETDGLDPAADNVIQIAAALVDVSGDGGILCVRDYGTAMEDPGRQIPPRISALTGIDNLTVQRRRINRSALSEFLSQADALVAHNAGFDAKFCRRLLPGISHLPWICSYRDVDWLGHRFDGAKLGHLLMQQRLFAPSAHDAMADVEALRALLDSELPSGESVLAEALRTAKMPTVRIYAEDAPYSVKDELKRFGYRWNPREKVWWTEIKQADLHAELAWLLRTAPQARPRQQTMTWHTRYA